MSDAGRHPDPWVPDADSPTDPAAVVTGDRIATDLLRSAVGTDQRLITRSGLAVCLRAALFADLALQGAIGDTGRSPVVTGDAPADDRVLAAVHRTVAQRPKVAWKRWYRHVDVDLDALRTELLESGRWTDLGARFGATSVLDRHADEALAVGRRARAVALGELPAATPQEAVLGVLALTCGGGHGAARPKAGVPIGELLAPFTDVPGTRLQPAHVAVGTAQLMLRRLRRRVG